MDALFTADLFLNFRTAFITEEADGVTRTVASYRRIASRYLQGYFLFDVLSTLPLDILFTNDAIGLVRLFKVSRMVKLVRVIRLLKFMRMLRLLKVGSGHLGHWLRSGTHAPVRRSLVTAPCNTSHLLRSRSACLWACACSVPKKVVDQLQHA